jgi:hypothetical protein
MRMNEHIKAGGMSRDCSTCLRFEVITAVTIKNDVFWMLRCVALVRTDVSEELTRATRRNIPEDAILHVKMLLLGFSTKTGSEEAISKSKRR